MQFIRIKGVTAGQTALAQRLIDELQTGQKVLWLTSGGSNIPISVAVMQQLPDELTKHLTVMPNDERYGPVGHPDSNWDQLLAAGFAAKQARLLPVLEDGLSFEQTAAKFAATAEQTFAEHDFIISQLGMGPDGHISGIKPESPATSETVKWVVNYPWSDFQRLTMTFPALRRVSAVYMFAFGDDKRVQLEALQKTDKPLAEQPAQLLKELAEAYAYNDQVGDKP